MPARRHRSQAGKGSLLVEMRRAATLKIGVALRHELQTPQDLPPEISSLLRRFHNIQLTEPVSRN
jgi:hypothetical protein